MLGVVGCWRASSHQRKPSKLSTQVDEEWKVRLGLRPIERELLVSEPTIGANFDREDVAQVVHVEPEEVRQQLSLVRCSHFERNYVRIDHRVLRPSNTPR